jgi:hypothetical protein
MDELELRDACPPMSTVGVDDDAGELEDENELFPTPAELDTAMRSSGT